MSVSQSAVRPIARFAASIALPIEALLLLASAVFPMKAKFSNIAPRRPRLALEVAVVLACKLLFIFCLWWLFFSPEHRTDVTPEKMSNFLLGPAETAPADEAASRMIADPQQ